MNIFKKDSIHSLLTYQIIDNVLLVLFCSVLMGRFISKTEYIVALLGGVSMMLMHLISNKTYVHVAIDGLFVVACLLFKSNLFFIPIVLYHSNCYKDYKVVAYLGTFLMILSGYFGIIFEPFLLLSETLLLIVLSVAAAVLAHRTRYLFDTREKIIRLRDESTERAMALKEKNKNLMEKQDYEIHLATLSERNRIAREIHDNVGHMLSRSILQVGALSTIYKEEPLHEQLVSVNDNLNQAMNSIRESVHDLHDDSIDLRVTIKDITKDMQDKYSVKIDYDMSNNAPRSVKYCFVTIIKEAMANVIKHSNADRVTITLREHPALYQLYIEDNGVVKKNLIIGQGETGIGLTNMQDRVDALGGSIRFDTGKGFSIFVSVPKEKEEGKV